MEICKRTGFKENASSVVQEDTLFHLETLLVVTTGDSEDVTLVGIVVHDLTSDFLADSSVVEGAAINKQKYLTSISNCILVIKKKRMINMKKKYKLKPKRKFTLSGNRSL